MNDDLKRAREMLNKRLNAHGVSRRRWGLPGSDKLRTGNTSSSLSAQGR